MTARFLSGFFVVVTGLLASATFLPFKADAITGKDQPSRVLNAIPVRPPGAITGSDFAKRTAGMSETDRQAAALHELRRGNVPSFMRNLQPVTLRGNRETATVWVMPDYLSIGSDDDFLRMPLTLPSALAIANEFGCTLPTPRIVDAIYRQARVKLSPQPLPAGPAMQSSEYYLRHQRMVQEQLGHQQGGDLTAGHKKDVVISGRLQKYPDRIAIYGWHRIDGRPIQPLSTVHGSGYADYSHGIRLVSTQVQVNSTEMSVAEAANNASVVSLLTDEEINPGSGNLKGLEG